MSSSSPEDEDCVVAVKFLGPQLSFCRPGQRFTEWINIRTENPCFYNSRVVYSKKDDMFRLLGSEGHLIGSWDLHTDQHTPRLQMLRFQNLPELNITKREFLDSCFTSEYLVESESTGETFLVKLYKKTAEIVDDGTSKMKTEHVMVFKLDEQGNAVYTQDIGDLCIFLSQSEPFAVPATSFPGMFPNYVTILDSDEVSYVSLRNSFVSGSTRRLGTTPFQIPSQFIV